MKRYCRVIKKWGGFPIDHELWIGEPKAGHLQASGFVEFISPPKEKAKSVPRNIKVETTTIIPQSCPGINETEEAILKIKAEADAKAKIKAQADAKVKKPKAKAKAKTEVIAEKGD